MYTITHALPELLFYNAMIFIRIGSTIAAMPVLGSKMLPLKAKLILCVAITAFISASNIIPFKSTSLDLGYVLLSVFYQFLVGMIIGLLVQFIFQSFSLAGNIVAMQMGLGFAQMNDPQSGISVPVISQFYIMMITLLFLIMNGHLFVIETITKSFQVLPLYLLDFEHIDFMSLYLLGGTIFSNALKIALPIILALLIANMTFGIMSKASPQINIFSLGFSVTLIIGIALLYLSVVYIVPLFTELYQSFQSSVYSVVME